MPNGIRDKRPKDETATTALQAYAVFAFRPVCVMADTNASGAFLNCGVATEGRVGMRRSEAEGSPNEESREAVARGRAGSENDLLLRVA